MRRRKWSIDGILRRVMLFIGVVLGLALSGRYLLEGSSGQPSADWKQWGKEQLAQGLVMWMEGQNLRQSFLLQKESRSGENNLDPAYNRFMAQQEMRKESSYLLIFGDENSNLQSAEQNGGNRLADGSDVGDGQNAADGNLSGPAGAAGSSTIAGTAGDVSANALARLTPAYHIREQPITGTQYMLEQLMDYDYLMKHFYNVHSSTTAGRDEMNAKILLKIDLSLDTVETESDEPQILIYHTHSQETFDDYSSANPQATIVGVGTYLTELLQQKGYQVIHDTSVYDLVNGQLDRNHAYNYALEGITGILQKYPSIQVILDVHRDGVNEGLHMVSEINGKPTAPIMFFNGMSQTPEGPIEYLPNPYKQENLAFSLQMQLDAAAYYPGLTRKIYLKGLRYNLHLRPRSALIEVGAQTNTYQEALNAMEPLAEVLDMVLSGEDQEN